jgi:hypothetical protein
MLEQGHLSCIIHSQDAQQLPGLRTLGHVAEAEQHALPGVIFIKSGIHPVKRCALRPLAPQPFEEHGVGFPVPIGTIVLPGRVFKLEAEVVWAGL